MKLTLFAKIPLVSNLIARLPFVYICNIIHLQVKLLPTDLATQS